MYDYLLYDNRTRGKGGFEWGIKVSTGQLQSDAELKRQFVEYCRNSIEGRFGPPSDFGLALGGVCPGDNDYLLCVTIENKDLYGRKSCAFVGIYCPNASALQSLLTQGDPLLSARQAYESAPADFALVGGALQPVGSPASIAWNPGRYPFQKEASPRNAAAILLGSIERRVRRPSIMGVATWGVDRANIFRSYGFAFCQRLPVSLTTPQVKAPAPESIQPLISEQDRASVSTTFWIVLALAAAIAGLASGVFYLTMIPGRTVTEESEPVTLPKKDVPLVERSKTHSPAPAPDAQEFLTKFEGLLNRMDALSPDSLLTTPEYKALSEVAVLPEYSNKRSAMTELLKVALPEFRRAVRAGNFRYFLDDKQFRSSNPAEHVTEIRKALGRLTFPKDSCDLLRSSFTLWAKTDGDVTREWCSLVDELAIQRTLSSNAAK